MPAVFLKQPVYFFMNWIDFLLIFIVVASLWSGWQRGFITSAIDLAVLVGSFLSAFFFYEYVAGFFNRYISLGVWALPVAFLVVIVVARLILSTLFFQLVYKTPPKVHEHGANKFLGLLPGLFSGLINATIIAALVLALPLWKELSIAARNSTIAEKLAVQVAWLDEKLSPVFDEAIDSSINKLTIKPESGKSVDLQFTVSNAKVREDLEAKMLQLVNQERAKEGLPALKADPEIAKVARAHSIDMFARGYFSHYSPGGHSLKDRLRKQRIRFITAGENLALAPTIKLAHQGLMNSPGHRANILQPSFGRLGIGIVDGGIHGLMVTQNFRN